MHNCKKMHTVGTSYSIFQRVTTAFFGSATLWLHIAIQNDIFSAPWGINDRLSHHKLQSWSASSGIVVVVVKISQDSIPWSVQFLEQKCIPFSFFVKKNYSTLFFRSLYSGTTTTVLSFFFLFLAVVHVGGTLDKSLEISSCCGLFSSSLFLCLKPSFCLVLNKSGFYILRNSLMWKPWYKH